MAYQSGRRATQFLGVVVIVLGVLSAGTLALEFIREPADLAAKLFPAAVLLILGFGLGGMLFAMASQPGREQDSRENTSLLSQIRDQLLRAHPEYPVGMAASRDGEGLAGLDSERLLPLLEEIRDIALMDDKQRQERMARMLTVRRQTMAANVEALIQESRWTEARAILRRGVATLGPGPEFSELEKRLDNAIIEAERWAFAQMQQRVQQLQKAGDWDEAILQSETFVRQFPDSAPGLEHYAAVLQARDAHIEGIANQLYEEIRLSIEQRSWRKALASAESLLSRCSKHHRADQVRNQLKVIRENAEVEHRNSMEAKIQEHVRAGRLQEAVTVAEEIMRIYPLSPHAQIASQLVDRLREKLATQPESVA